MNYATSRTDCEALRVSNGCGCRTFLALDEQLLVPKLIEQKLMTDYPP